MNRRRFDDLFTVEDVAVVEAPAAPAAAAGFFTTRFVAVADGDDDDASVLPSLVMSFMGDVDDENMVAGLDDGLYL